MLNPPGGGQMVPGYNLPNNLAKWMDLSTLHQRPLPWGELPPDEGSEDPYRWFLFRPPFLGFHFSFVPVASASFRVDRTHNLHPFAGFVGQDVTMDLDDAGDEEYAEAVADTQIAFGFEALAAGRVEVLVDAQNANGTHDLRT
jgi:hypothetical protein